MKRRRIIGERHRYWNIKGCGHFVLFFCVNCLSFRLFAEGRFEHIVAPLWYHSRKVIFHG
jgi:hypothetical protein